MNEQMKTDYDNSVAFWDQALASSPEDYAGEIDLAEDWKQIGSESLLAQISQAVQGWSNVLDYGCGTGWADVVLVKNGVTNIKAVDVAANAVASASYYAKAFQVEASIDYEAVDVEWLSRQTPEQYEHAFCFNVLDVVPDEVTEGILSALSQVCRKGASLLVALNPFFEEDRRNGEGCSYHDHYLYVNDILRVNNHTDEEWIATLSKYFEIEKLEHFRWDGEAADKRRLFYLKKR